MNYRLLVVDGEESVARDIKSILKYDGYSVDTACSGKEALKKLAENIYNLIILDTMLPDTDGLNVLKKLREKLSVPVIILTAKREDEDKVAGFEAGADDYLTKPCSMPELKARIKALLRRTCSSIHNKADVIDSGDLKIDVASRRVQLNNKPVYLTSKEFDILLLLVVNPQKVYSRESLMNIIWDYNYYGDSRTVDVHIRRLREKIEKVPSEPQYLLTKWGEGYYYNG